MDLVLVEVEEEAIHLEMSAEPLMLELRSCCIMVAIWIIILDQSFILYWLKA
jgi:hypothetical protein